jgi:hypothetical protein
MESKMKLKCLVCGNENSFTAEAQATIDVVISGDGKITSTRPFQQIYKDVSVQKPWKCNTCGSVGKIQDEANQ